MKKIKPTIFVFLCKWCPSASISQCDEDKLSSNIGANIRIFRFPCSSAFDPIDVALKFRNGADGILLATCPQGNCHYFKGNWKARNRFTLFRKLFQSLGYNPRRLRIIEVEHDNQQGFVQLLLELSEELSRLGPITKEALPAPPIGARSPSP